MFPSWKTGGVLAVAAALLFAASAQAAPPKIVALGDSLTAGYGVPQGQSFPVRLEEALAARGVVAQVVNAGVPGDTSAGGLARLDHVLDERPNAVILELGINDEFHGTDPGRTYANLDAILQRLQKAKVPVLIAGMKAIPKMTGGPAYAAKFDAIFRRLAQRHHALLYPFFLAGVNANPALNQKDGFHPNPRGVAVIVAKIVPYVLRLIGASK